MDVLYRHYLWGTVGKLRKKLRTFGVPTRIRTPHTHTLNTSRKPDDLSHLTWYASSPSKLLQACHCVNEASSVWGTKLCWMSYITCSWLGCPCSLLVFFEEHAAHSPWGRSWSVGDVVYHTAGLALTNANLQNDSKISQTRCTILLNIFISFLYMFRASMCSS